MEISEILREFEYSRGTFPSAAVAQALERRDEIVPDLLQILERIAEDPARPVPDDYFGHIFAMYLLAKFREPRAFAPLVKIASTPGEIVFDLMGDIVTQDFARILASVCGNEIGPLQALIESEQTNEWVRSVAMRALVTLVATGQRGRDAIMEYFAGLFQRLERKPSYVWDGLANHCTDLYPEEVLSEIRRAYDEGLIDPRSIHPEDVRSEMARGKDAAVRLLRDRETLIDDLEQDMSWMSAFQLAKHRQSTSLRPLPPETYRRPGPKVGRNDPCPCGSGKKSKKCCGLDIAGSYDAGSAVSSG